MNDFEEGIQILKDLDWLDCGYETKKIWEEIAEAINLIQEGQELLLQQEYYRGAWENQ